jgi:hypothetical protein
MTVGELRKLLDGLADETPVVIATYDEDGRCDYEYESASAEPMTAIRLHRRKRDYGDEWVSDSEANLVQRAQQPRRREQVLLVG